MHEEKEELSHSERLRLVPRSASCGQGAEGATNQILGQGKGLTPRAPSSRCPRELFTAILFQILRATVFLGMVSEPHQLEKPTNPAFVVELNIIPGRYEELKPFF